MDPYIERPAIWGDFHISLIAYIRGQVQSALRPKYAALLRHRIYVVEVQRLMYSDVTCPLIVEGGTAVLNMEEPVVFESTEEEYREPYLEIIEPGAGNRLITAIEILSPTNKLPGLGKEIYLQKRTEVRQAGASLVEIDLLGDRQPVLALSAADLAKLPAWRYLVGVSRPPRQLAVYPIPLQKRLPKIRIPLAHGDPDVILDLQAAFSLAWEKGTYPMLSNYDGPPPGAMSAEGIAWCKDRLREHGY